MNKAQRVKYAAEKLLVQGDFSSIDQLFSVNYIAHAENKEHHGVDFIKRFSNLLQDSISNIEVISIEILLENEELVTWMRTIEGVHVKKMMEIPASNKKITWNEMVISRFDGDKIAEEWLVSELKGELLLHANSLKNK